MCEVERERSEQCERCFCCSRFCYLGCVVFFALPIARFDSLPIGETQLTLVPPPSVWCEFILKSVIRLYYWEPFACSFAVVHISRRILFAQNVVFVPAQPTNRPIDRTEPTNQLANKHKYFQLNSKNVFKLCNEIPRIL